MGTAVGLNLPFGIPLEIGVISSALDMRLIPWMQKLGFRRSEAFIVTGSASSQSVSTFRLPWPIQVWGDVIRGFAPTVEIVEDPEMLYLALGIIGTTVMPHNLYIAFRRGTDTGLWQLSDGEARGDGASPPWIRPSR